MQQVELHKLNLDADINAYLDFKIPNTWPAPITMRNLMTHTSGFEEVNKNTHMHPMPVPCQRWQGALLKAWVPERLYPPGKIVAYSTIYGCRTRWLYRRARVA